MLEYYYLKCVTPLYSNAQNNSNFAKEAFLAEAKAYETLLMNHYLNTTKYWGCHSHQQQYP